MKFLHWDIQAGPDNVVQVELGHCGLQGGCHCQSPAARAIASMPNPPIRWRTLLAGCRLRSWRRKMGIRGRELRYDANRG